MLKISEDKRIILKKWKSGNGYRYLLKCLYCHKLFELRGGVFNSGWGRFCCLAHYWKYMKGKPTISSTKFKKGNTPWTQDKKGIHLSPQSEFKLGNLPWNTGLTQFTDVRLKKMADDKQGEKNPSWNDGSSFEPYTTKFNNTLKELICKRDNYICQKCGKTQEENGHRLSVHHIDYDKKNCSPRNLISLCHSCNIKVNFKKGYWEHHFTNLVSNFPEIPLSSLSDSSQY